MNIYMAFWKGKGKRKEIVDTMAIKQEVAEGGINYYS